jgi:hypothetical protein
LYDYPRSGNSSNYPVTIYYKGAAILGMLRYKLGDEKFFGGINSYIMKYGYGNTTTELLRTELEEVTGMKLDTFFNQWVYGKGWPVLKIFVAGTLKSNESVDVKIDINQTQKEDYGIFTNVPIELGFVLPNGKYHYETIILDSKEQTFELKNLPYFTGINANQGPNVRSLLQVNSINFSITNIEDDITCEQIKLYPNPGYDYLNIESTGHFGSIKYKIFDILGNTVYFGNLSGGVNILDINSNKLNLSGGIYYLTYYIGNNAKSITFSVIK